MNRRTFLVSAAALAASGPASAAGMSAAPDAVRAFGSLSAIHEGGQGGTVHVLFAPWCTYSARFYRQSRAYAGRASFRWIPISGGLPEGSEATERLLSNPRPESLSAAFTPLPRAAVAPSTPLSDQQDSALVSRLMPLIVRDTGRGVQTPTIAWQIGGGQARMATGSVTDAELAQIVASAS